MVKSLEEVEKRILNKSQELFFRYGLKSVTVDDISRELGISKKTLYTFFPTKKDIVHTITKNFLDQQEDSHQKMKEESSNAVEELVMIMESVKQLFENMDTRIIYDMQRYYNDSWNLFLTHKEEVILNDIRKNLLRGIEEGLFRPDINVEIIARMRMEQVQLAMDPGHFPPEKYNIAEVNQQLLLQYLNGVCTEKGIQELKSLNKKYEKKTKERASKSK